MRPSTQSTWPVIHSDRSEKRNAAMAPTSRGSPRLRAGVIASTACRNSSGRLPRCIGEHQPRREAVRFNPCLAVLASDVPGEGSDRRLRCLLRWAAVVFQRAGDADAPPRTTLRLGTGKQSSGRTGPASSKPQPMSELRNHPRKLTPNSATFTRTGQRLRRRRRRRQQQPGDHPPSALSRPVEDCDGYPALAGTRNSALDDPSAGRPD